jgi:hypothetical protein
VDALEHERLAQVVSVGGGEQARPQVVVLALEELRVVTQVAQRFPVDEHRRVEERGAEERVPPERPRAGGHDVRPAAAPALVEIGHRGPDDRGAPLGLEALHLPLQALGDGDVVGVQPRDVAAARPLEATVQRACKPELPFVAEHLQPAVLDSVEHGLRPVRRRIVDDQQLEVCERLREDAAERVREEARVVVHGQQDGDERHGR